MFVKLKDNYVNLDLIKKVTDVKAYYALKTDYEIYDIYYFSEIKSPEEEAKLIHQSIHGTIEQQRYIVTYGFEIYRINEKHSERIITGTDRIEAGKYLESFIKFLNTNELTIPEIKI